MLLFRRVLELGGRGLGLRRVGVSSTRDAVEGGLGLGLDKPTDEVRYSADVATSDIVQVLLSHGNLDGKTGSLAKCSVKAHSVAKLFHHVIMEECI